MTGIHGITICILPTIEHDPIASLNGEDEVSYQLTAPWLILKFTFCICILQLLSLIYPYILQNKHCEKVGLGVFQRWFGYNATLLGFIKWLWAAREPQFLALSGDATWG